MSHNTGTLYFKSLKAGEFELDNVSKFVECLLPHLKLDRFEKMISELSTPTPAPAPAPISISDNVAAPPPPVDTSELVLAEELSGVIVSGIGKNKFSIVINMPMNADTAIINFDYNQYGIQSPPSLCYFTVSAQCRTNTTGKASAASGFVELVDGRVLLTLFGKKNNTISAMVVIKFN